MPTIGEVLAEQSQAIEDLANEVGGPEAVMEARNALCLQDPVARFNKFREYLLPLKSKVVAVDNPAQHKAAMEMAMQRVMPSVSLNDQQATRVVIIVRKILEQLLSLETTQ